MLIRIGKLKELIREAAGARGWPYNDVLVGQGVLYKGDRWEVTLVNRIGDKIQVRLLHAVPDGMGGEDIETEDLYLQQNEHVHEAFGTHTMYIPTSQDIAAKKSDLKYGAKPEEWSERSAEMFDEDVKELSTMPEFQSIEEFVKTKLDNDEYEFSTTELNALVLGMYHATGEGVSLKAVKQELTDVGLKFVPREPVKHVRGFGSPVHGSNRYAGNAAGSGTASGGWIGIGGGQGMIGGGKKWSPSDPKSLGMGARRR